MGKNLQKVSDMLDGSYKGKIQVGFGDQDQKSERKVGDKWTDSDGVEWEQKQGYRMKVSKFAPVGLGKTCTKCEKLCTQPWDKSTQDRYGMCYYCQLDWEVDMKGKRIGINGNKWQHWVRLQQLRDMEAIERDMESEIDEISRIKNAQDNPFDESVANAVANANIDTSIKVNKKLTGH